MSKVKIERAGVKRFLDGSGELGASLRATVEQIAEQLSQLSYEEILMTVRQGGPLRGDLVITAPGGSKSCAEFRSVTTAQDIDVTLATGHVNVTIRLPAADDGQYELISVQFARVRTSEQRVDW
jgi:hypothetical protein